MPECAAEATWNGTLTEGTGDVVLDSGSWAGEYDAADTTGATDPEELLAAAHASCFAMTISYVLSESGHEPEHVDVESVVSIRFGESELDISSIETTVDGSVPDAARAEFVAAVDRAENACPVSKALAGTEIQVTVPSEPA